MKALASQNGRLVRELGIPAPTLRRYVLSLPVTSLVCGIQSRADLRQDITMARNFQPLTESEIADLLAKAERPAADGHIEQYKVSNYGCDWWHRQARTS
jgi:predicted aldo/keto reductase-like oxidoreductase